MKLKYHKFLLLGFIIFISGELGCADSYSIGDTLYVWARGGLNVRQGPTTKSPRLSTLLFGERVKVSQTSQGEFNLRAVNTQMDPKWLGKESPVILYGNWVQVELANGQLGYVVDQYLLKQRPNRRFNLDEYASPLSLMTQDTTYTRSPFSDGEALNYVIECTFEYGVKQTIEQGGVWYGSTYSFPGFTIEEVLILMFPDIANGNYTVTKNWPAFLAFRDDGLCDISLTLEGDVVVMEEFCSC